MGFIMAGARELSGAIVVEGSYKIASIYPFDFQKLKMCKCGYEGICTPLSHADGLQENMNVSRSIIMAPRSHECGSFSHRFSLIVCMFL